MSFMAYEDVPLEQKDEKQELLKKYEEFGIRFPEIVICQMILETGRFKSQLYQKDNNLFGFKPCKNCEKAYDNVHMRFNTKRDCLEHMKKYQARRIADYEKLNRIKIKTTEQYLDMLECMHIPQYGNRCFRYAEDPNYRAKLLNLKNKYFSL